jgi:cyclopropane fatty-acyl-phospholipid synthase-like methyltransferase
MKVYQNNKKNKGIFIENKNFEELSLDEQVKFGYWGYRHGDALWFEESKHITYKLLSEKILKKYPNCKTILEIGCGAGSLSHHLRELNNEINVITLDGNQDTISSPYIKNDHHFIVLTDEEYTLIDEKENIIKFDLILSFEHFEHIHSERFGKFLDNIKKHSHKNTVIIATASTWPEGRDHCNIKTKEEWGIYLINNGFEMLNDKIIGGCEPFNFVEQTTSELIFKLS